MPEQKSSIFPFGFLLLAVTLSAATAVIAAVSVSNSLDRYAATLLDDRRFAALAPQKASPIPGTYEEALQRVREKTYPAYALIFEKGATTVYPDLFVADAEALARGMVITSDGWIMTASTAAFEADEISIAIEGKWYVVAQVVQDIDSPYVLMKVAEASGLATIGFGDSAQMRAGEMAFALTADRAIEPLSIVNIAPANGAAPEEAERVTDVFTSSLSLEAGTPVVNGSGDVIGFAIGEDAIAPLHQATLFARDVVRGRDVVAAGLGVYVSEVSRIINIDPVLAQGQVAGALIGAPVRGGVAVVPGSPAANAGLLAKDIIVAVDGTPLTADTSLAEMLQLYDPGESARLSLMRSNERIEVTVTFIDSAQIEY
ncbi:serine protease [Patescibacteria group bacterium]|nr:serine protease [Patescibacteria group bacterium]